MYKRLTIYSIILIVIDQVIKLVVNSSLKLYESITIIKKFFNITYVQNKGAAWSILSGNRFLLIGIAIIALFLIFMFFVKNKKLSKLEIIFYSLLIGGIVGNLIDRVIYGYVVDYLDFNIFGYNFPIFNFADICIVISVVLILVKSIKEELCKK